jgi:hypothetical protein
VIFRQKQVQVRKWTPTQAARLAVEALKNSHYCEHGEVRTSCSQQHVGGPAQAH